MKYINSNEHNSAYGNAMSMLLVLLPLALLMLVLAGCACSNNAGNDYASEDDTGYIGTWTGKLDSTTTGPACYAAQDNPVEITVKSVETTGRMVMDVKVLYHGHTREDLDGDVDSFQGDKVVTLTDQTATLEDNGFTIVSEQDDDGKLEIEGSWTGVGDSLALDVTVSCTHGYHFPIEDAFTLTKKLGPS